MVELTTNKYFSTMKNISISSGNFTAAGNFTGYNLLGERVHVYKRQMDTLGWKEDKDVKFPFYAVATVKEFQQLGEDGEPTGETFDRLTATSVFKTEQDIINAHVANASTDAKITKAVRTAIDNLELTEEQIAELANAAV
jgi:hypothetical protein